MECRGRDVFHPPRPIILIHDGVTILVIRDGWNKSWFMHVPSIVICAQYSDVFRIIWHPMIFNVCGSACRAFGSNRIPNQIFRASLIETFHYVSHLHEPHDE